MNMIHSLICANLEIERFGKIYITLSEAVFTYFTRTIYSRY